MQCMATVVKQEKLATSLGANGRERVVSKFSFEAFTKQISTAVDDSLQPETKM
eukprot:m.283237 g.283237  ORF g.283237 m.283237 type:complete len:53 (-) comp19412_c0_seq4:203-361(-)